MKYTENDQAVMLLCAHLPGLKEPKPLTVTEWDALARVLQTMNAKPKDLLDPGFAARLPDALGKKSLTKTRIGALLSRGHALGFALADWDERGISLVTRASSLYPARLRRTLQHRSPPLFYVAGNVELLQAEAVGVVGSRDASAEALDWVRRFGGAAAGRGLALVSGAAKGIDEAGMLGALEAGGRAVGYLAESLAKTALSPRFRHYIGSGSLALLTSFAPDARFSVGAAMGRNRFIYSAARAVCVAASAETGGTMEGAKEALKQAWGVVCVRPADSPGIRVLESLGARRVAADPDRALDEMLQPEAPKSAGRTEAQEGLLFNP